MSDCKIYCDTSLVIDYFLASGREPEAQRPSHHFSESAQQKEEREFWEQLLQSDKRFQFAKRLRSIVGWQFPKSRLVISPFVLLEIDEWYCEEVFKRHALEASHVKAIQTYSRKQIGEFIQTINKAAIESPDSYADHLLGSVAKMARGEDLAGIIIEPIDGLKFDQTAFLKVSLLSIMQMGMADIVHLMAAETLNCTHFAAIDSDFQRLRTEIEAQFSFKVLYKEEVFQVLKPSENHDP